MSGVSTCASSSREAALEDQQFNPRKLFVGGLGPKTTAASLKDHFRKYGPVTDAAVVEDRLTGRSRGFGFIVFERDKDAEACVAQTRHNVDGVSCEIRRAVPRDDARNAADQGNRCKVYVGGLREDVTEDTLREYFKKYGTVDEVQLMLDRNTQRSRGFAFVLFRSATEAENSFGPHPDLGPSAEAKFAEPRSVTRRFQQQQQQLQQRAAAAAAAAACYFTPATPAIPGGGAPYTASGGPYIIDSGTGIATTTAAGTFPASGAPAYYLSAYHAPPSDRGATACFLAARDAAGSSVGAPASYHHHLAAASAATTGGAWATTNPAGSASARAVTAASHVAGGTWRYPTAAPTAASATSFATEYTPYYVTTNPTPNVGQYRAGIPVVISATGTVGGNSTASGATGDAPSHAGRASSFASASAGGAANTGAGYIGATPVRTMSHHKSGGSRRFSPY